jgi:hypothetical protein
MWRGLNDREEDVMRETLAPACVLILATKLIHAGKCHFAQLSLMLKWKFRQVGQRSSLHSCYC